MADARGGYDLVASFFTLSGTGFGEAPRHSFMERCRAAAAAGFTGIGLHVDDLPALSPPASTSQACRRCSPTPACAWSRSSSWAAGRSTIDPAELERTVGRIEAVADAFGGRHVSAGEFRGDTDLDLDAAATRLDALARRLARRGLQVAVEGFPWSALAGPTTVPELLRRVQAPNVGQLIDVWHFFNNGGTPETVTRADRRGATQRRTSRARRTTSATPAPTAGFPVRASWTSPACCGPCSTPASPARGASRSTPRSSAHYPSTRPPAGPQPQHQRRSTRRTHHTYSSDGEAALRPHPSPRRRYSRWSRQ